MKSPKLASLGKLRLHSVVVAHVSFYFSLIHLTSASNAIKSYARQQQLQSFSLLFAGCCSCWLDESNEPRYSNADAPMNTGRNVFPWRCIRARVCAHIYRNTISTSRLQEVDLNTHPGRKQKSNPAELSTRPFSDKSDESWSRAGEDGISRLLRSNRKLVDGSARTLRHVQLGTSSGII